MKTSSRALFSILLAGLMPVVGMAQDEPAPATVDERCEKVGSSLQVSVAAAGSEARILQLVEDAMIASEECACEIVKAAIIGSKADQNLVGQIVHTAASASPGMTPTIAECAMAVAPDAGSQIRLALEKVLVDEGAVRGGKELVSEAAGDEVPLGAKEIVLSEGGKEVAYDAAVGKEAVAPVDPTPAPEGGSFGRDWGKAPVDIRGIYLIPPAVGGFGGFGATEVVEEDTDVADQPDTGGRTTVVRTVPVPAARTTAIVNQPPPPPQAPTTPEPPYSSPDFE